MQNGYKSKDKQVVPVDNSSIEDIQAIYDLMQIMQTVKTTDKEAKLNAITISDGRGGRILL